MALTGSLLAGFGRRYLVGATPAIKMAYVFRTNREKRRCFVRL
jgi:hypothetical protein